jgi:hypothetical protein
LSQAAAEQSFATLRWTRSLLSRQKLSTAKY